uniref:Uncharacterized protein n=1 Tax=Rhizophora mucronata TaxID=61149 RepID=A0A2P2IV65_RHIMU
MKRLQVVKQQQELVKKIMILSCSLKLTGSYTKGLAR